MKIIETIIKFPRKIHWNPRYPYIPFLYNINYRVYLYIFGAICHEIILNKIVLPVSQCKQRWRNLRTAFQRNLKRNKSYYLKKAMMFMLPFMRRQPNRIIKTEEVIFTSELSNLSVISDTDLGNDLQFQSGPPSPIYCDEDNILLNQQLVRAEAPSVRKKRALCENDYQDQQKNLTGNSLKKALLSKEDTTADLEFFRSLLPDVSKMTDYQKRQFKQGTLELIDSILDDGPNQNTCCSNNHI